MNPAQLNVLSLMAYIDTEQEQKELQDMLLQFYRFHKAKRLKELSGRKKGRLSLDACGACYRRDARKQG